MSKLGYRIVGLTLLAGAAGGFLVGWALPSVLDWLPMTSPIRGGIDVCFAGVEKMAYSIVKTFASSAPVDYSIVYTRGCFTFIGICIALIGLLVLRLLRSESQDSHETSPRRDRGFPLSPGGPGHSHE